MASREGPVAVGTDGNDFNHREKVANQYHISAVNKNRLKKGIFAHLILGLLMLLKLMPDILDKSDYFVLEVEELEVPQPCKWEYLWLMGTLFSFVGLTAMKKNKSFMIQVYFALVNVFSTVPVIFALMLYFAEFYAFCAGDKESKIQIWQGVPVAALWYAFLIVALQVHVFTLIFSYKLMIAWKLKVPKKDN